MKKYTLLFATLLAMSGMAFGQVLPKVLWENMVDTITTGAYVYRFSPLSSPSGNILVQYYYILNNGTRKNGVRLYNNNGKIIWNAIDFYNQRSPTNFYANVENKNYTLLSYINSSRANVIFDSTLYLGKDFNFLRKFEVQKTNSFLVTVEDGVFHNENEKTLIKYDISGKEEWRFDTQTPIKIMNQKPPYVGLILTPSIKQEIIILNKYGKKIGFTEPQTFNQILPANDSGFWLSNQESEYIKYDSTGKQTAKYSYSSGIYSYTSPTVLSDNSILLNFITDKEVILIKVLPNGEINKYVIPAQVKYKDYSNYNSFIYKLISQQNRLMYSIRLPEIEQAEANIKYKIGVIDFNNTSSSWSKDVFGGASNGIGGNAFTFEADNTFFQAYSDPNQPLLKTFKVYDVNGNIKWISDYRVGSPIDLNKQWKIKGDMLYFSGVKEDSLTYSKYDIVKVRFTDGKIVWKKQTNVINGYLYMGYYGCDLNEVIKTDKDGDDIILYRETYTGQNKYIQEGFVYKIAKINTDGTDKWAYVLSKANNFSEDPAKNSSFLPTDDGKIIVLSQETKDNKLQYILRKISPCNDLNAIAITGNTEACPTEKVKLSIPKEDGLTYQWQKDGQDLPNVKDVVYDFSESGNYTVTAKDEICQNSVVSNSVKVSIRPLPTAQISATKSTFCEGEKTTIASKTNGTFFQWQKDGKDIPNATTGIYEVSQAGDYRVGVRDDKCPQVGYSNVYTIITKPLPEAAISTDIKGVVYEPFTVKMLANSGAGLNYQWLKDDAIIPNETTAIYEAKKSGKYNVSVTKDGCVKISDALTISILIPLANQEEIGEEVVEVYPNPNQGNFKITLPKTLKSADVQLFDAFGRERSLVYTGEQAQAEGITQGVYFLRVQKGEKVVTSKILIE